MEKSPRITARASFGKWQQDVGELRHQGAGLEELRRVDLAIIRLDGLRHDDGGGVAALDGLGSGSDCAGDVATTEDTDYQHQ